MDKNYLKAYSLVSPSYIKVLQKSLNDVMDKRQASLIQYNIDLALKYQVKNIEDMFVIVVPKYYTDLFANLLSDVDSYMLEFQHNFAQYNKAHLEEPLSEDLVKNLAQGLPTSFYALQKRKMFKEILSNSMSGSTIYGDGWVNLEDFPEREYGTFVYQKGDFEDEVIDDLLKESHGVSFPALKVFNHYNNYFYNSELKIEDFSNCCITSLLYIMSKYRPYVKNVDKFESLFKNYDVNLTESKELAEGVEIPEGEEPNEGDFVVKGVDYEAKKLVNLSGKVHELVVDGSYNLEAKRLKLDLSLYEVKLNLEDMQNLTKNKRQVGFKTISLNLPIDIEGTSAETIQNVLNIQQFTHESIEDFIKTLNIDPLVLEDELKDLLKVMHYFYNIARGYYDQLPYKVDILG